MSDPGHSLAGSWGILDPMECRLKLLFILMVCLLPQRAESAAVVNGRVYDCATETLVAGARLSLRQPGGGGTAVARTVSDHRGFFSFLGVDPGTYILSAHRKDAGTPIPAVTEAQRQLGVEDGDVLTTEIGVPPLRRYELSRESIPVGKTSPVRPICDPAFVPPAPATVDRYIVH